MNTKMRNLTLTAAALAALTVIAPSAAAQVQNRGGRGTTPRQESPRQAPRQELRGNGGNERNDGNHGAYGNGSHGNTSGRGNYGGYGRSGGYGTRYVAPRPVVRYGYGYHATPFRIFSGFRFYPAFPGPGYVYIANYGWVLPPFFGAVWVPAHYDIEGNWIEGFWR